MSKIMKPLYPFVTLSDSQLQGASIRVAPFSPAEVVAIACRQANPLISPYTCPDGTLHTGLTNARKLEPGPMGLTCRMCGYTQAWVNAIDCLPSPGMLFTLPSSFVNPVFHGAMITPYELLRFLTSPPLCNLPSVMLIYTRSRSNAKTRHLLDFKGESLRGSLYGDTPEGKMYRYDVAEVRQLIAAKWFPRNEKPALTVARYNRHRRAALYDLEQEIQPLNAFHYAPDFVGFTTAPTMTGTDKRLIAAAQKRLFNRQEEASTKGRYTGDMIDYRFLTPRLLLTALTAEYKYLPEFVRFGNPAPEGFPYFIGPGTGKQYIAVPYPDASVESPMQGRSEKWFDTMKVIKFLSSETREIDELKARRALLDTLESNEGESFIINAEMSIHGIDRARIFG